MNGRLLATPLGATVAMPSERQGGIDAALLGAIIRAPGVEPTLDRLRQPNVLAVTTGQQPALFTGPLYTIHKALSAAALAELLEARWKRPVVPVFWVAGDDHDFAEANHASVLAADGSVVTVTLRTRAAEAPMIPMYREPLGGEIDAAFATLEAAIPPSEFRDAALGWLRRHFSPDATVAGSAGGALAELLAPMGVACLDATHPAAKRLMAPLLLQSLVCAQELDAEAARLGAQLVAEGEDPGIVTGDGATLVMVETAVGRDRLVMADSGTYRARRSGEAFSLSDLEGIAESEPERLSPNVLLRPVVESVLVPTVAYLAGPGELRYLALTPPLYRHLGVYRQLALPRWSGVIIEPRVDRVLEKYGITYQDLTDVAHPVEARLIRSQVPPEVGDALAAFRESADRAWQVLDRVAHDIDPTLDQPVKKAKQQALSSADEVERKLLQHLKKRQETELTQIGRARTAVLPLGKPQERVLTLVPFLARHGPEILRDLLAAMRDWYRNALEAAPPAS